jgi:hypothetical protein
MFPTSKALVFQANLDRIQFLSIQGRGKRGRPLSLLAAAPPTYPPVEPLNSCNQKLDTDVKAIGL